MLRILTARVRAARGKFLSQPVQLKLQNAPATAIAVLIDSGGLVTQHNLLVSESLLGIQCVCELLLLPGATSSELYALLAIA